MARGRPRRPTRWIRGQECARCLICGLWKPCASGFYHAGKGTTQPRSRCKDCMKLQRHGHGCDDDAQRRKAALKRAQADPSIVQVIDGKRVR